MEMSDRTKKILVYGGGAASIVALYLYVRNRNAARAASGFAPGTGASSGGGAAGNPESAAQINAATQLAIAQGAQDIAKANIEASTRIAGLQSQTALGVAGIQASAARSAATTGALGQVLAGPSTSAGGTAIKGIFDLLGNAIKGIFGPNAAEKLGFAPVGEPGATPLLVGPGDLGWSTPGSAFVNPASYGYKGNIFGIGAVPGADSFNGSIGSGGSNWFGSSEFTPGNFTGLGYDFGGVVTNPDEFVGPPVPTESTFGTDPYGGIPSGFQD